MGHIIGLGRYGRETYPTPGGAGGLGLPGAIVRVGFDCTTVTSDYAPIMPGTPLPQVLRDNVNPIEIPLTGFVPGNAILFLWVITIKDGPGVGGGVDGTLAPVIDVGAGLQLIGNCVSRFHVASEEQIVGMALIQPSAGAVTQDPVLGLAIWSAGADSVEIPASLGAFTQNGSATFVAAEIDAASLTQSVATTLEAYPSS